MPVTGGRKEDKSVIFNGIITSHLSLESPPKTWHREWDSFCHFSSLVDNVSPEKPEAPGGQEVSSVRAAPRKHHSAPRG